MFDCVGNSIIFMISQPLTRFKKVVSLENTIVWATLGFIIDNCPALTTCVTLGEFGLIIS